jgi:carbon-monoxide dehydrogenase iron sulfur subunit
MRTVFVDPERCIGCLQCEFACAVEHSQSRSGSDAVVERPIPRKRIHVHAGPSPNTSFPNKCRHCDPAPCLQVCPTGAIFRDPDHDAVLIDAAKCIGCAMCAMVCPFDVLTFYALVDGGAPVAVKCDACVDRLRAGRTPACVDACKAGALTFGDINDLVAAGRRRETAAIFAATTDEPNQAVPDHVAAWRALGAAPGQPGGAR